MLEPVLWPRTGIFAMNQQQNNSNKRQQAIDPTIYGVASDCVHEWWWCLIRYEKIARLHRVQPRRTNERTLLQYDTWHTTVPGTWYTSRKKGVHVLSSCHTQDRSNPTTRLKKHDPDVPLLLFIPLLLVKNYWYKYSIDLPVDEVTVSVDEGTGKSVFIVEIIRHVYIVLFGVRKQRQVSGPPHCSDRTSRVG